MTTGPDGKGLITGSNTEPGLINGEYQISASMPGFVPTTSIVKVEGPKVVSVTISLELAKVVLPVQLLYGINKVLPPGSVTLRGDNVDRTCTLVTTDGEPTNCTPTVDDTSVQIDPVRQVAFAKLVPAVYTVSFTSTDNRYRSVSQQVQLFPGVPPPAVVLVLDLRASLQTGVVRDAAGGLLKGATVSLRFDANVESVATDIDGKKLVALTHGDPPVNGITGSDGEFSFANVPDGLYRVMVDAPGWNRTFSGTITLNSALTTTPPAVTIRLTRAQRQVALTVASSAAPLDGAATGDQTFLANRPVTLIPVEKSQPLGAPENTALTGFTLSSTPPYTLNASQVPTGKWTASVDTSDSAFGPFVSTQFDVPDPVWPTVPSLTPPDFPPVTATVNLQQGRATITVSWKALCSPTSAPPATGTLRITLTRTTGGATHQFDAPVSSQTDGSGSAVASVVLPPGAYSWKAAPTGGWEGTKQVLNIPDTAPDPTSVPSTDKILVPSTDELLPPVVPATASFAIDGAPAGLRKIAAIPAGGGTTVPAQTDATTGEAGFCLPPDTVWTFRVRDTGTPTQILVPDKTGVDITRAGPNKVAFNGFTFQPTASLALVPRREPDTTARGVTLKTSLGATTVFSESLTIPAEDASVQGTAVVIGPGSYSVTATPAGTAFGPGTLTGVNPATTPKPTTTMPYLRVLLTVLATTAGTPTPGAVVTLSPANGTGSAKTIDPEGTATFRDIPADTYNVTATVSAGAKVTFRGELPNQELTAGSSKILTVKLNAVP